MNSIVKVNWKSLRLKAKYRRKAVQFLQSRTLLPPGNIVHSDDKLIEMLRTYGNPEIAHFASVLATGKMVRVPKQQKAKKPKRVGNAAKFYESDEWRAVRYFALVKAKGCCQCCGARPSIGKPLHVDHIKPRSKYPELELDKGNLQVLCLDCNLGKSNKDQTDWRSA